VNVITLYQPVTRSAAFYTELQDLLDEVSGLPGCSIICSDLSTAVSGMLDQQLTDILTMNDCRQHVSEPTHRYGGLLDLLITQIGSSIIRSIPTVNDLGVSDHFVVYSRLNMSWSRPSTVKIWRRNFKNLNISYASSIFMCPETTTNDFTVQLRDDVMAILDELAPSKLVTKRQGSHRPTAIAGCPKKRSMPGAIEEVWNAVAAVRRPNQIESPTELLVERPTRSSISPADHTLQID
jgi:hypothetical protein